jgi:hypothetical protein
VKPCRNIGLLRQEYNCFVVRLWKMKKGPAKPGLFCRIRQSWRFIIFLAIHILLIAAVLTGLAALLVLVLLALLVRVLLALLLSRLLAGLLLILTLLRILLARLVVLVGHVILRGWNYPVPV